MKKDLIGWYVFIEGILGLMCVIGWWLVLSLEAISVDENVFNYMNATYLITANMMALCILLESIRIIRHNLSELVILIIEKLMLIIINIVYIYRLVFGRANIGANFYLNAKKLENHGVNVVYLCSFAIVLCLLSIIVSLFGINRKRMIEVAPGV